MQGIITDMNDRLDSRRDVSQSDDLAQLQELVGVGVYATLLVAASWRPSGVGPR